MNWHGRAAGGQEEERRGGKEGRGREARGHATGAKECRWLAGLQMMYAFERSWRSLIAEEDEEHTRRELGPGGAKKDLAPSQKDLWLREALRRC